MQALVGQFSEKLKELNSKFSTKTKIFAAIVAVLVIGGSIALTMYLNRAQYEVLFTGLNDGETSEIMAKLNEMGVEARFMANGTITVPKEIEQQTKAQLVGEGYPKSGFTYNIFKENVTMLSTDDDRTTFKIFDLQERIGATIGLFTGVREATVQIALSGDKKYVLEKDKPKTSASVVVIMEDGGSPSDKQVAGIRRLVAKSIPGLEDGEIVIVDGNGVDLTEGAGGMQATTAEFRMALEQGLEATTKQKILHILEPAFGSGNVFVSVKSSFDVDKKITETIQYLGNEDNKGVISEEHSKNVAEGSGETVGGIPGTENNAEAPIYPGITTNGDVIYYDNEADYKYLVSQVKEQIQSDGGKLTDLSVSATILNTNSLETDRLTELKHLIGNAVGIGRDNLDEKIAIFTIAPEEKEPTILPEDINPIVLYGIAGASVFLLLLTIIIILLTAKKRKKRKLANEAAEMDAQMQALQALEDEQERIKQAKLAEISNKKESALHSGISTFTQENPEITAQIIKTWLRGGDPNAK